MYSTHESHIVHVLRGSVISSQSVHGVMHTRAQVPARTAQRDAYTRAHVHHSTHVLNCGARLSVATQRETRTTTFRSRIFLPETHLAYTRADEK